MSEEIQRFYKHTNDKSEIGWETCKDRYPIGPNLQQAFSSLLESGLTQRGLLYGQEGGWSGDLYVIHRRLFKFQNEISKFLGDSGTGGNQIANVYEVIMNSTQGWSQYISLILKGNPDEKLSQRLSELDFAPKHSYLAKNDEVPSTCGRPGGLWLDDFIEVPTFADISTPVQSP